MSPDQYREAHAILKWTRRELADATAVADAAAAATEAAVTGAGPAAAAAAAVAAEGAVIAATAADAAAADPPLMRAFNTLEGLKTITRRGKIGTSTPVFGLRPMR
jgi:hypothetical protein